MGEQVAISQCETTGEAKVSSLNVQFSDSTQAKIVFCFAGLQDPEIFANLGTVDTGDARWETHYEALPAGAELGLPSPD